MSAYEFNAFDEPQIEKLDSSMFNPNFTESKVLADKTNMQASQKVTRLMKEQTCNEIRDNFNSISSINNFQ